MKMKMKMKKGIALFAAVMMLMTLAACGEDKNTAFSRGIWSGSHYQNEFMALAFDLPEGWEAASDEEIAEAMGIAAEQVVGGRFREDYLKAQSIYDAMVWDAKNETGTSIIIMAENLTLSAGGTGYDEKAYADTAAERLLAQDAGYEIGESRAVAFAGKEYYAMDASLYEGRMHRCCLFCKEGNYMTSVIISYLPDLMALDLIFEMFGAAE